MKRNFVFIVVATMCAGAAMAAQNSTRVERPQSARSSAEQSDGELFNGAYDGSWVLDVTTTVGACPPSISNVVDISESRIASIDDATVSPWGYVDADGTLVARLTKQDGHVFRAHGQLRSSAGAGAWSSSTEMCGGTWRAHRSAAEHAGR
jgi:hypothetical protein